MYPVSTAFHTAVRDGNHQMALLIFQDAVFTNADINIDTGITFNDYFNLNKSLKIGQTPSNEISFTLFNDDRLLNSYAFGDFLATIGVQIGTDNYSANGNAYVITKYSTYAGYSTNPYLTRGGQAVSSQPGWPVASIMAYDGKVYVFGKELGQYAVYNDTTGAVITQSNPVNAFMQKKAETCWEGLGIYYNKGTRILFIYDNTAGERRRYEFCPLGHFSAERPDSPNKISIDMTCYDLMQRFDRDMPTAAQLGLSYPTTIGTLYQKMCQYVGLPFRTATFINSDATIAEEPEDFMNSTMRTVLGWIAEAAASNARIDRDGYVILDWIRSTSQVYSEDDYTNCEPHWYTTKKVTKLYNRDTSAAQETTYGAGDEPYLIQDNPLLKGAT